MMEPQDITIFSLFLCFLLLLIPVFLNFVLRLGIIKSTLISLARMSIQLFLMAIYLKYLFFWNNPFINVSWMVVMIGVATFSVVKNCGLGIFVPVYFRPFFNPLFKYIRS